MITHGILESDSRSNHTYSSLIWLLPKEIYRKKDSNNPRRKTRPIRSPHPSVIRPSSSSSPMRPSKAAGNQPGTPNEMAHSQFQGLLHPPDTMIKQPVVNLTTNEATDIVVKEDRIEMVSNVSSTVSYPTHEDHKIRFIKSLDLLCQDTAADRSNEKQHTTVSRTVVAVVPSQPRTLGAQRRTKSLADFTKLSVLGEGAFGAVHLCLNNFTQQHLIIKSIYKERILVGSWVRDRKLGTVPSEIHIMSVLNSSPHDNILPILDFFEDDEHCHIEMETHGGPSGCVDLFDLIEHRQDTSESEVKAIFRQVVRSIEHLHRIGIVHRDIKDENFVVDSKGVVKLIDFGSAAYVKDGPFSMFVGTAGFAPPEVLGNGYYSGKPQDVWSLGILLYTLVFGENPFVDAEDILNNSPRFDRLKVDVSKGCLDMISCLLSKDVDKRPDIVEVINSEWLNE